MAGPWEKYAAQEPVPQAGPWTKYAAPQAPEEQQPSPQSFQQQAQAGMQRLGQFGAEVASAAVRPVAKGVAALPLMAMDAGVGARNLLTGSNYELPSSMFNRSLDEYTIAPQTTAGKVAEFGSSVLAGARLPAPSIRNPAPTPAPMPRAPSTAQQVIAEGEKHGVPVFYDDVGGPLAKRIGVAAEPLGALGTGARRGVQAKAAQSAADELASRFAPNVSDDVPELVQAGLKRRLSTFRQTAGKLYERAAQELDPAGNVPTVQMDTVIAQELAKQDKLGTLANPAVREILAKYQSAPKGNFTLMRELRSQLGSDISDFYTGANKTIGEKGVTALRAAQEALEADMAAFAKAQGGNAEKAWRAADGFYKANLVPFKEAGFRDLVKTAEPEKAWRYLLAQGSLKSRAVRMYNSLDEGGRSAVRYGLIKDALEAGQNPNGSFSPAKFAKYLEDHQSAVQTFFKGRDLAEIRGFQTLMRHVERAGQFAENPPTGQRLIPYLFAGAIGVSPEGAAVVGTAGMGTKLLFQTKAGRDLLLAMGRARPGTAAMDQLVNRASRLATSAVAVEATRSQSGDPSEAPSR